MWRVICLHVDFYLDNQHANIPTQCVNLVQCRVNIQITLTCSRPEYEFDKPLVYQQLSVIIIKIWNLVFVFCMFAQLIWENTEKVGCGLQKCDSISGLDLILMGMSTLSVTITQRKFLRIYNSIDFIYELINYSSRELV